MKIKGAIFNRKLSYPGAPKARAQELIASTTQATYRLVSQMMFGAHLRLFELLVALERLRMDELLDCQELGLFVNGVNTALIEDSVTFDDRPDWVSNKVSFTKLYFHYF